MVKPPRSLTDLPNIGDILAEDLTAIGVDTRDDLVALGSLEATRRLALGGGRVACRSMLLALEGAIRGVTWFTIPEDERTELWRKFQLISADGETRDKPGLEG